MSKKGARSRTFAGEVRGLFRVRAVERLLYRCADGRSCAEAKVDFETVWAMPSCSSLPIAAALFVRKFQEFVVRAVDAALGPFLSFGDL